MGRHIYASPTLRTLGTAVAIARELELPIIVVPGLAECSASVHRGGLIKNGDELYLAHYGRRRRVRAFLKKKEIERRFESMGVDIEFDYRDEFVGSFEETVRRLMSVVETEIVLCV